MVKGLLQFMVWYNMVWYSLWFGTIYELRFMVWYNMVCLNLVWYILWFGTNYELRFMISYGLWCGMFYGLVQFMVINCLIVYGMFFNSYKTK